MTAGGRVVLYVVPAILGVVFLFLALRGALSGPDTPPARRRLMAACYGLSFILWGAQGLLADPGAMPRLFSIVSLAGISCGVVGSILLFTGLRRASVS